MLDGRKTKIQREVNEVDFIIIFYGYIGGKIN
jgi:hypothetical protein